MSCESPIGFFDSGVGGLAVRDAVLRILPGEDTVYIADSANCPYGPKPAEFVRQRSLELSRKLVDLGCKMVVVACNTATAAAIDALRAEWPQLPIIGMEPAVKPAAARSKSGIVGVLATKGTFGGRLYRDTCSRYAGNVRVIASVADEFVEMVERGEVDGPEAERIARGKLEPLLSAGADSIVLGCTHFLHLAPLLGRIAAGRAELVDPSDAVAGQVRRVLAARGLLADRAVAGTSRVMRTSNVENLKG